MYIEWRANVSQFKAFAAWFALWVLHAKAPYSGNPANGSEIDVMEYVPFFNATYSLMNQFHSAVIWGQEKTKSADPPYPDGLVRGDWFGINLERDEFHTWGLEWHKDRQIFTIDGNPFWENTQGVSGANDHGLRISVEIANGNPYNPWGHAVGRFEDNPPDRLPSQVSIDYLRVYARR